MQHPEARSRQVVIGVLTPHTGGFYYGAVVNGILSAARESDAVAIAFETSRLELLKNGEVLSSTWVDGWLAVNEFHNPPLLAELRRRGQPIVHLHSPSDVEGGTTILPDNEGGARFATTHLLRHGHRRIAFAGNLAHVDIAERLAGYRAALAEEGIGYDPCLVFDTAHHRETDGCHVAEELLRLPDFARRDATMAHLRVTALMAGTDRLALGAMSRLQAAGLELPRDFAITGFDDADAAQFADPPLTTVKQSFYEAAVRGVSELLGAIREGKKMPRLIRVPTHPMVRRSCGCVVSHSLPPSINVSETTRMHTFTRALLSQAGRTRVGTVSLQDWPEAELIARSLDVASNGLETTEPVRGDWWSGFLLHNRDAESTVRVMELLESTLQAWNPPTQHRARIWGLLRDLRVALMQEWQRTERVMVAHYESVTEAAYRLANALSSAGIDPCRDLSWIRWSNPQRACCALWNEPGGSDERALKRSRSLLPPAEAADDRSWTLYITGEYTSQGGVVASSRTAPPLSPAGFPPRALLDAAQQEGSIVTIAGIPGSAGREHGLLAVVAPLAFEQLEYVGTPGDWAVQLGAALDRAAAERDLRASAELDTLTGLANRATLLDRVERLCNAQPPRPFALLFIDLDDFKKVNDSLGHFAGDQLLVQIAERLTQEVSGSDANDSLDGNLTARLGGDEFVVVLAGVDSEETVLLVVERLQARLRQSYALQDRTVFVSASIGVTFARGTEASALDLLRDADTAMYRAKVKGRARHEIFHHGMHKQALEKLHLDERLRLALERDELELWYQPIVELATGADVGAEALIRWRHPEQGLLLPARFLAVAEDVGLTIPFSEWVIRRAIREAARWPTVNGKSIYVNVNVPAAHIKHSGFVAFVEETLEQTQLNPHAFGIEIVESTLLDEAAKSMAALSELISLGVRVAIDDFGTGYSSLSYLRNFPASTLKIDRSFVTNIPGSTRDEGITRAIIAMGQGLGLGVVAEGIETREQLQFVSRAGCDYAQGFLLCAPLELQAQIARLGALRYPELAPVSSRRDSWLRLAPDSKR